MGLEGTHTAMFLLCGDVGYGAAPAALCPRRHAVSPTHSRNECAVIPPLRLEKKTLELPTLIQSAGSDGSIPEDKYNTARLTQLPD